MIYNKRYKNGLWIPGRYTFGQLMNDDTETMHCQWREVVDELAGMPKIVTREMKLLVPTLSRPLL